MNDPVNIYRISLAIFISMQQETHNFWLTSFYAKVNNPCVRKYPNFLNSILLNSCLTQTQGTLVPT